MRRSVVFLAPITLCLLAVFACDDSGGGNVGTIDLDAGKLDVVTPPPPVVDAGAEDADADAAAPTTVTVAVLGSAAARTGVQVVFSDATGATLETRTTGADGKATSTGTTAPAMATALMKNERRYGIVTWTGVAAGDVLAVRGVEPRTLDFVVGSYDVKVPEDTALRSLRLEASTFCNLQYPEAPAPLAVPASFALQVETGCVFGTTSSVLAYETRTAGTGTEQRYGFKKNLALPGVSTPITIDAWAAPAKATLTASNIPADGNVEPSIFEISAGAPFHTQYGVFDELTHAVSFDVASGFADALQGAITIGTGGGTQNDLVVRKSGALALTADLGSPLPRIENDGAFTGDPTHPTFHWQGDTTATVGGAVRVQYTGPGGGEGTWTIVVPAGATSVTAPVLPADAVAAFLPAEAALTDYVLPSGAFLSGPGFTPATFRAAALAAVDDDRLENVFLQSPMPADGTYKLTVYAVEPGH